MKELFAGLVVLALASAGCLQSNINGATNGNGSPSSTGTPGTSTTGTGAGPTAAASSSGGSSAGSVAASSAGGSSAGSVAGSSTGGGSSSGAGTTGGTITGDAGPCIPLEDANCGSNDACCSGACDEICRQAAGQPCLTGDDCASGNCPNNVCVCAQTQDAPCAADADCCNGVACQHLLYQGVQYGECCNPVGGSCQGDGDCCDSNCVNGSCACLPVDSEGCTDGECCLGQCVSQANGGGVSACLNAAGDTCDGPWQCISINCDNGSCGTCSASTGGPCATTADCCTGGTCAESLILPGIQFGQSGPAEDAGFACCGPEGASCDGGQNRNACCSGACSNGLCTCAKPTDPCYDSASCCAGGACMSTGFELTCCQMNGQFCLSTYECCSGFCSTGQTCACVADGGACGPVGYFSAEGPAACCSGACSDAGACE